MPVERTYREAGAAGEKDLTLQPTSPEIHIWLTFCEAITEDRLIVSYRELLNPTEIEEESRFHFARDRHRYLVTRALVRTVLSRYASVGPKDWVFSTDVYGRPHIANTEATGSCLSFSVSHTQGLIVLGVAKGRSLGVDVENFAARDISIDIANHYFAPQEVAALHEMSHHQGCVAFLNIGLLRNRMSKRAVWASLYHSVGSAFTLPMTMPSI